MDEQHTHEEIQTHISNNEPHNYAFVSGTLIFDEDKLLNNIQVMGSNPERPEELLIAVRVSDNT